MLRGRAGRRFSCVRAAAPALVVVAVVVGSALPGGTTLPSTQLGPEVIVALDAGADPVATARRLETSFVETVPGRPDLMVVRGPLTTPAAALARDPAVRWAAPNAVARMATTPDDPLFPRQWNLGAREKAAGSANWVSLTAPGLTGQGVTVAILDTGVTAHSDLDGVLSGEDFVDRDSDATDTHGHGTHIAGTVAETTGNALGAAGVAPGAAILPVRVLDDNGLGDYAEIIAGLEFAIRRGARVINLSFAGDTDSGLCEAVERAVAAGVVVVAAAGNERSKVGYPAACASAIAVSAVTLNGRLAPYSNTGPEVTLAAPGGESRVDTNGDGYPDGILQYTVMGGKPGYYYAAGTSMATPHVSGAAALLLQNEPSLTPTQIRDALTMSATDIGPPGQDSSFGAGLLDIAAAVAVRSGTPPQSASEPRPTPPTRVNGVARLAGETRFDTAVAVSLHSWPSGGPHALLATGGDFADALAAGALAGRRHGPLLLTRTCELPGETAEELRRLRPSRITVVGGEAAVCETVLDTVRSMTGASIERISGVDRYATAAAISQAGWSQSSDSVYIASGGGFADGLAGGAAAAHADGPLLLSEPCSVPPSLRDELVRLAPQRVAILGGQAAICTQTVHEIAAIAGVAPLRLAGADRYSTAVAATSDGWSVWSDIVFVTGGAAAPDGLAAGAAASLENAPLLLVPSCGQLPQMVADSVRRLRPSGIVVVGGTSAVCDGMLGQLEPYIRQ